MNPVLISRLELLKKLKENKLKHVDIYNNAILGYAKEAEKVLRKTINDLKKDPTKEIRYNLSSLAFPLSYEKNYADVISMLEMSDEEKISVSMEDFQRFVLDEWEWKKSFELNNSRYLSSRKGI